MQLSAKMAKLENSNRKLKHTNKKCKHNCNSDSNDSDSSWSDGSGSTGKLDNIGTKCNKINHHVKTYPSPNKVTNNLDSKRNSISIKNTWVLWRNKDLQNLNDALSKLNGNNNNTQPEVTAKLLDPEMSGAHLNNVNSSFSHEQEGRVTAVITQARYQRATRNQTKQRVEHSARTCPSNAVIKVLLDSGSDGNLKFNVPWKRNAHAFPLLG